MDIFAHCPETGYLHRLGALATPLPRSSVTATPDHETVSGRRASPNVDQTRPYPDTVRSWRPAFPMGKAVLQSSQWLKVTTFSGSWRRHLENRRLTGSQSSGSLDNLLGDSPDDVYRYKATRE